MKKVALYGLLLFFMILLTINTVQAQDNEWVNQVIVVNSGKFESSAPYFDYVTVESYNPATQVTNIFNTIYTQSAQDVVIKGNMAYVAAQDSIIMYNIDTYQRVAAVSDSGLSRLYLFNDKLVVTKKYPIKRFFVEVLNASNLALLAMVQNISGDCGAATSNKDTLYVAVNGGYSGLEGHLACISNSSWLLGREINFGTAAVGISDLYNYNGYLYSINQTPSGSSASGSITQYNLFYLNFNNILLSGKVGYGCGIKDNLLYLNFNGGIGSFDLNTLTIANGSIIPAPMSSNLFINAGQIDYVNGNLYLDYGNRPPTFGIGIVASATTGDSLTSFPTGINAYSLAIDYRTPVGIQPANEDVSFRVFPNPAADFINVKFDMPASQLTIKDIAGREIYHAATITGKSLRIDCAGIPAGIYFITVSGEKGSSVRKFIKQ